MLERMSRRTDDDLRQGTQPGDGGFVDLDFSQRGLEGGSPGQRESAQCHPVRRSEQHDTSDLVGQRCELRVGVGGDRPRVHITGVRRDQRLGCRRIAVGRGHVGEELLYFALQFIGVRGVKHAGHGRRPTRCGRLNR
jgi:hypothetical protein